MNNLKQSIHFSEAVDMSYHLFIDAENEAYKHLTKEELASLLRSAQALQKENGHLYLFEDEYMPMDARVDVIHKPSYAIAAIAIYTLRRYPEVVDKTMNHFIHLLLESVFSHGVIGHGIEAEETVRRTLLMLCKAGLRTFLEQNRSTYPIFTQTMESYMQSMDQLAEKIDTEGYVVTECGFSKDSINHLIKELVAYWNGNVHAVFVYGTLRKGERAHGMLSGATYGGKAQLKNYAMYHLGSYPGIVPCKGESVLGELYFVSENMIPKLDRYEDEGSLYLRASLPLSIGPHTFHAECYVYNRSVCGYKLMREDWNAKDDDLIWYAAYGSNLSSERFACYISGGLCRENGRTYFGCSDPTAPRDVLHRSYPGELYFGNTSPSWDGHGVAFYDPSAKGHVHMKLYLITRSQFHEVMRQEGKSSNWYGRAVCLGLSECGIPVYTLTSESRRPENAPATAYVELIANVLQKEFHLKDKQINSYLKVKF